MKVKYFEFIFLIAAFALFILNSTTLLSFASNFQKKKKPPTLHYFVDKIAHSIKGSCKVNKTKLNEEDFFSELSLIMNRCLFYYPVSR